MILHATYSPEAVANRFLDIARDAGRELSNMKLQKLVHIAHGFSYPLLGKPMIGVPAEAWKFGPVYPTLYRHLRRYGADRVEGSIEAMDAIIPGSDFDQVIAAVWEVYGGLSAGQLSARTHRPGTPWSVTRKRHPHGMIDEALIRKHYNELVPQHV